jgi:hypothetical protein
VSGAALRLEREPHGLRFYSIALVSIALLLLLLLLLLLGYVYIEVVGGGLIVGDGTLPCGVMALDGAV